MKPLLSILICTVPTRQQQFEALVAELNRQVAHKPVEICTFADNFEHSIGHKRNNLIQHAKGEYVCHVDDDDRVHNQYVDIILEGITEDKPDCVGLTGIITTSGRNPKRFEHSIRNRSYYESYNVYYRPPNHLNPIKKELIKDFKFPDKYHGEDFDWCMNVCEAGVLRSEYTVRTPYYFYDFDPQKSESLRRRSY